MTDNKNSGDLSSKRKDRYEPKKQKKDAAKKTKGKIVLVKEDGSKIVSIGGNNQYFPKKTAPRGGVGESVDV